MGERLNQLRRALEQELDARLEAVDRQAKSKALAEENELILPCRDALRAWPYPSADAGDR